jgi:excisionase family DNA binding protein
MHQERRYRSAGERHRLPPSLSLSADSTPAWFTIAQLCRRWQLGRKTVYKFIDAKILPAWRVGSHLYRVAVADVEQFESQNRLLPK